DSIHCDRPKQPDPNSKGSPTLKTLWTLETLKTLKTVFGLFSWGVVTVAGASRITGAGQVNIYMAESPVTLLILRYIRDDILILQFASYLAVNIINLFILERREDSAAAASRYIGHKLFSAFHPRYIYIRHLSIASAQYAAGLAAIFICLF